MIALIGVASLAFDTGYMYKTRNELQNIADATALAAARSLGDVYTMHNAYIDSTDRPGILLTAQDVAQKNRAGGKSPIAISSADLEFGIWNGIAFTVDRVQPNAIRATIRRDGVANGPVGTFFGRVLGVNTVDLSAKATAALSGQSTAKAVPPFAISSAHFEKYATDCDLPIDIKFTEDSADCAGWHTFLNPEVNPGATIEQIFSDMLNGTFNHPLINLGDELWFTRDPVNQAFDEVQAYYALHNVGGELEMNVAIFNNGTYPFGCANPSPGVQNTPKTVIGFATIIIEDVLEIGGEKVIRAKTICNNAEESRGNGYYAGNNMYFFTMGSIPSLVE